MGIVEKLDLSNIIQRESPPVPWTEGEKIPWNDPGFSQRMLREHLSQDHDAASRRFEIVDGHVEWIHYNILAGAPSSILDLGCGPGLYSSRLATLGHRCQGIDFSPASIEYAKVNAEQKNLTCQYTLGDIRETDYGQGYDLAMLIFGEFNVFRAHDARLILEKAYQALDDNGIILLEPHTFEAVQMIGEQPASWYSSEAGLFSETPHLYLYESFWIEEIQVAIERYFILDQFSNQISRYSATVQAYRENDYQELLQESGFRDVNIFSSLLGTPDEVHQHLFAITARK